MDNQNTRDCCWNTIANLVLILVLMDNQNTLAVNPGDAIQIRLNPCFNG